MVGYMRMVPLCAVVILLLQLAAGQKSRAIEQSKTDPCPHLDTEKRKLIPVTNRKDETVHCCACGRHQYMDEVCRPGNFSSTICRDCPHGYELDDTAHGKDASACTPIPGFNHRASQSAQTPTSGPYHKTSEKAEPPIIDKVPDVGLDGQPKPQGHGVSSDHPHTTIQTATPSSVSKAGGYGGTDNTGTILSVVTISLLVLILLCYAIWKYYKRRERMKHKKENLPSSDSSPDQSSQTLFGTSGETVEIERSRSNSCHSNSRDSRDDTVEWVCESKETGGQNVTVAREKPSENEEDKEGDQTTPLIHSSQISEAATSSKVDATVDDNPSAVIREMEPPPRQVVRQTNDGEEEGVFAERATETGAEQRNAEIQPQDLEDPHRLSKLGQLDSHLLHVKGIPILPTDGEKLAAEFQVDINKRAELERNYGKGDVMLYLVKVIHAIRENDANLSAERLIAYWKREKPELGENLARKMGIPY